MRQLVQLWRRAAGFLPWVLKMTPEDRFRRRVERLPVGPGDLALDCGANVGAVSKVLARKGAEVHAFEPNPFAFQALRAAVSEYGNARCIPAAVDAEAGKARLFLHENSASDEVHWSNGSSLLAEKGNVSKERFVEVDVVDLSEYVLGLDRRVSLLKLDVEGAECRILRKMIETGAIERVDRVFVEMHDEKIPELREESEWLRRTVAERGWKHVELDWL